MTARERAAAQGWYIDPDVSPGPPHPIGECACNKRDRCDCKCHGRTFKRVSLEQAAERLLRDIFDGKEEVRW